MPFDRSRYPANWRTEIRPRILARAGEVRHADMPGVVETQARCEWCGVENGDIGHRRHDGTFEHCHTCSVSTGEGCGKRSTRIVLTIAHIHDRDPMNVADDNLAALCQRCHLTHDGEQHAANAGATRRQKRIDAGQAPLELETGESKDA